MSDCPNLELLIDQVNELARENTTIERYGYLNNTYSIIREILQDLSELKNEINSINNNFNQLNIDINSINTNFNQLNIDINELRINLDLINNNILTLNTNIETNFNNLDIKLQSSFLNLETNINARIDILENNLFIAITDTVFNWLLDINTNITSLQENIINYISTNIANVINSLQISLDAILNAIVNIDLSAILDAILNINFNPTIDNQINLEPIVTFDGVINNNIDFNPTIDFNPIVEFNGVIDNNIQFNPIIENDIDLTGIIDLNNQIIGLINALALAVANIDVNPAFYPTIDNQITFNPTVEFKGIVDNQIIFNPVVNVDIQAILNAIANIEASLNLDFNPQFTAILNAIANILAYLQANLNIDLSAEIQLILEAIANINFDADFQLVIDTVNNKDCDLSEVINKIDNITTIIENNNNSGGSNCELDISDSPIEIFNRCPIDKEDGTEDTEYYTITSIPVIYGLELQQYYLFNQLLEIRKTLCDLNYEFSIPYQQKRVYPKDIYLSIDWFVDDPKYPNSKTRYPDRQVLEPDLSLNWDNIWEDMKDNLTWKLGQVHAMVPSKNYDTPIVSGYFKDREESEKVLGYLKALSLIEIVSQDNWLRLNEGASKRSIRDYITKPYRLTCYSINQDKILFQYKRTKLLKDGNSYQVA